MRIPKKHECYQAIFKMNMMEHIVVHSIQVCRVATFLVDHLKIQGVALNRDMVQASALLHDITKTRSIETKENHALTGHRLINGMGYPEVGDIVRQHVRLDTYNALGTPNEAEVVNYADKRVLHDQIVSLEQRMNYVLERYARTREFKQHSFRLWQKTEQLEEKLFGRLPFSPGELPRRLNPADGSAEFMAYRDVCRKYAT